jgi:hypothetical protein
MPELDLEARPERAGDPAADLGRYLAAGRRVLGWVGAAATRWWSPSCWPPWAHELLEVDRGGRYRLAPETALLADPAAPQPPGALLPGAWVRLAGPAPGGPDARPLHRPAGRGRPGGGRHRRDQRPQPDPPGRGGRHRAARPRPARHAHLTTHGGRHLELGCGVGNVLLSLLVAYPGLTAVGVELDPVTLAETRRRAQLLGVAAAGFQVLQVLALPPGPLVLGRGLLLARRPPTPYAERPPEVGKTIERRRADHRGRHHRAVREPAPARLGAGPGTRPDRPAAPVTRRRAASPFLTVTGRRPPGPAGRGRAGGARRTGARGRPGPRPAGGRAR